MSKPKNSEQPATKVCVLTHCAHGKPYDVAELSGAALAAAIEQGCVDPSPKAVAYAQSLKS